MRNSDICTDVTNNKFRNYVDVIDQAQCIFNDILMMVIMEGHARHKIGLIQVSPLIADTPGWYIWTNRRKGAYVMQLSNAEPVDNAEQLGFCSDFLVKYYPSPKETTFDDFSETEKKFRRGDAFDESGTPKFDYHQKIDDALYAVGVIQLLTDERSQSTLIRAISSNRTRHMEPDYELPNISDMNNGGLSPQYDSRWKLMWELLDKLILGFCYVRRCVPVDVRLVNTNSITNTNFKNYIQLNLTGVSQTKTLPFNRFSENMIWPIGQRMNLRIQHFGSAPKTVHPWINRNWWKASSWNFPPDHDVTHRCLMEQSENVKETEEQPKMIPNLE